MYMKCARDICLRLLVQRICCPFNLARLNAGKSMPARIAMIAITTSNSIKVKAALDPRGLWKRRVEQGEFMEQS